MVKASANSRLVLPWLLLLVAIAAFWPGLRGGFIFDDIPTLAESSAWRIDSLAWPELLRALGSDISGAIERPLVMLSFGVNHALFGDSVYWLKLGNLVWHGGNGVLVWLLVRQILSVAVPDWRHIHWVGAWVAALWLLHPLQTSTVLYVVQRMEIAATSGTLLSLLGYAVARSRQIEGQRGWSWLLLSVGAMLLGLGFKESALLCPVYALWLEACVFRFRSAQGRVSWAWVAVWLGVLAVGLLGYLCLIVPRVVHWPYSGRGWGPAERLLTQIPVLAMYLKQILLPLPESYLFYYDNFVPARALDGRVLASGAVLALLGWAAWACRHHWPLTTLGVGWFFISHLLTSNLWPLELAFEHRNYLALLGVMLALLQPAAWAASRLHADARVVVAMLPIVLLGGVSHIQAKVWGDPLQLAWTLENRNPDSQRALVALGAELVQSAQGNAAAPAWSMGVGLFEKAAGLSGEPSVPLRALILTLARADRPVAASTWADFRRALTAPGRLHIKDMDAVVQCRISGYCHLDDGELLDTLLAVVEDHPNNPSVLTSYANFSWSVLGERELAVRLVREATQLRPEAPQYRIALAKFLLASGQLQEGRALMLLVQQESGGALLSPELGPEWAALQRLAQQVSDPYVLPQIKESQDRESTR